MEASETLDKSQAMDSDPSADKEPLPTLPEGFAIKRNLDSPVESIQSEEKKLKEDPENDEETPSFEAVKQIPLTEHETFAKVVLEIAEEAKVDPEDITTYNDQFLEKFASRFVEQTGKQILENVMAKLYISSAPASASFPSDYLAWKKKLPLISTVTEVNRVFAKLDNPQMALACLESLKDTFPAELIAQTSASVRAKKPEPIKAVEVSTVPVTESSTSDSTKTKLTTTIEAVIAPAEVKTLQLPKVPKQSLVAPVNSVVSMRQHIVESAKQEAYVLQRIAELRKEGLWSPRRLPKVAEPLRIKTHWDYLLEEMEWLAVDFHAERRWKEVAARKLARQVVKYHLDKSSLADRVEKEEVFRVRRLAMNTSKLIKQFWMNIGKFCDAKKEVIFSEKRKKFHSEHLQMIVDKAGSITEKIAQDFTTPPGEGPSTDSDATETDEPVEKVDPKAKDDDDDFDNHGLNSDDDEETIDKQEEEESNDGADPIEEVKELEMDQDVPIEDLLKMYGYLNDDDDESTEEDQSVVANREDRESSSGSSSENTTSSDEEDESETPSLLDPTTADKQSQEGADKAIEDTTNQAESIQPKGNTLSSAQVSTKIPFLLRMELREYQHIGLDWMVAMYEHELNGILADEMGLGKTIQTIALIAHLACDRGIWGPHLIVVPSSVMLNWETEFKKWCPALKILTYYGNTKDRKLKRKGWTKRNTFHVCITSYKLVVQDHASFRRKKWVYLILDEAQHIKNFRSQRWQMLLNFNSTRRLLLTGTPLQNDLMELWSLMHFLMPNVFQSHREFKDWFGNPVSGMLENNAMDSAVFKQLHKIIRPFLLRRLKRDVEKQLPQKYEHVVYCSLSKRQRHLYDEFMSQRDTKNKLASGNFLSIINILMQLRKVCNHPNLFDPRPTLSPLILPAIRFTIPLKLADFCAYKPLEHVDLSVYNIIFTSCTFDSYSQFRFISLFCTTKQSASSMSVGSQYYVRLLDKTGFQRLARGKSVIVKQVKQTRKYHCFEFICNSK